jgi:hypothetical protein
MLTPDMLKITTGNIRRTCLQFMAVNKKCKTEASLEHKLQSYFASFGGPSVDFSTVAHLFDEIYHQDFVCLDEGGNSFSRELLRQCHAYFFEVGSKIELLDFKHLTSTPNKIEIKFCYKRLWQCYHRTQLRDNQ